MLLRSKIQAVKPHDDGSCRREFVVTKRNPVKRKVYDENGDFVRDIDDVILESKPIPIEEKLHVGQCIDMFDVSVLKEAGVQVNQITNFDRSSLDQKGQVVDQLDTLTEKDFE